MTRDEAIEAAIEAYATYNDAYDAYNDAYNAYKAEMDRIFKECPT